MWRTCEYSHPMGEVASMRGRRGRGTIRCPSNGWEEREGGFEGGFC